ncbi:N-acetyltransferase family protein [Flavobacterium sp. JP2137]|uniref:GNAT family N-acetyltransferase n=1 Tax=Flavobacterium sp. JP2137 TaxID=3414510 RepID=UPI003D2FE916
MKFTPRALLLKNGKEVILRSARISDTPALIQTIKNYLADSTYIPQTPEEFTMTLEEGQQWIASFITKDNSLLIVAEFDGAIIGNIDINGHQRQMMAHTAVIGMGILSEWRNTGLGTLLMREGIAWAKQQPILELLWLQVYPENDTAMALYKKMGFEESGIIKNFFKHHDRYYDNLTMSFPLKQHRIKTPL